MSEDFLVAEDDMLFLNGQDEGFDSIDSSMNGEPKSAEELSAIRARVLEMEEEAAKLKQLQNQVDHQMVGTTAPATNTTTTVNSNNATPVTTSTSSNQASPQSSLDSKAEVDLRSIYVGNTKVNLVAPKPKQAPEKKNKKEDPKASTSKEEESKVSSSKQKYPGATKLKRRKKLIVDYGATAEELEAHFHGCGSINRVTILCNKYDGHPKGFAYIEFADKDSVQTAMAMDESLFRGRQIKVNPKRTNRPGLSTTNRGGPVSRSRGFRSRPFRGGGVSYMYSSYRPMRRGRGLRRPSYFPY